jgi:hypothetical protein
MDEWSRVNEGNVLTAAVSFGGALHLVRAENNSTARRLTWDSYEVPTAATWRDLLNPDELDWRRLGFARFSSGKPAPAVIAVAPRGKPTMVGPAGPPVTVRRQVAPWLFTRPYRAISIPYWAMLALTGTPSFAWIFRAIRRSSRRRRGLCGGCGYDLRATNDRCPECGEVVPRRRRESIGNTEGK